MKPVYTEIMPISIFLPRQNRFIDFFSERGAGIQKTKIIVADPHPVDADADPDLAFHFDVDPDPAVHSDAFSDTDPTFQFDADPDPDLATWSQII
jgi:hypothetical protein